MDKIIETLLQLLPFGAWLEQFGLSKELSAGLAALLSAVLLYLIIDGVKRLLAWQKDKKTARDLSPYFEYQAVKRATEWFIPTRGQNLSPTYEEEIGDSSRFIVKRKLIPWFIKNAFDEKKESDKYYLVLADSGMGKTTLLINLYVQYKSRWGRKCDILLLPFGDERIFEHLKELIKKREKVRKTILLLDAFDEYKGLRPPEKSDGLSDDERFRQRLDEVVGLTRDFREVVITSRTQYFPGQENEAYTLKIPRFDDKGFHTLVKMYLSPFDDGDIKRYLNKKYGVLRFWNRRKKRTAKEIVEASPKLMVRPMLLSYIDYLVDGKHSFKTTYDIYEVLVEKWLEREATKRKHESTSREQFKRDLYTFSRKIALVMYDGFQQHSTLSVDKETARQLCAAENLNMSDYEITGQSLLTRDAQHRWKFAHKSILEFFLAKEAKVNSTYWEMLIQSNFVGMDMVKMFCTELGLLALVYVKGGTFLMGSEEKDEEKPIHEVQVGDFYLGRYEVTFEEYDAFCTATGSSKPSDEGWGRGPRPVINVSWDDAIAYCNWLSEQHGYTQVYTIRGKEVSADWTVDGYRLPTEAEWEYAARGAEAGAKEGFKYAGSNNMDEVGWYWENSGGETHPVGQKKPNQLGLYDMSGNVWEWCWDWYGDYPTRAQTNPRGADSDSHRVNRGGGWSYAPESCSAALRNNWYPTARRNLLGFRLARSSRS